MKSPLDKYKRIVVKVGSALLVDAENSCVKTQWLETLGKDFASLIAQDKEIIIVSSGTIALGRSAFDMPLTSLKLEEGQAAASIGQIILAGAWQSALNCANKHVGQVLITWNDTENRRRYLNVRNTIDTLLKYQAIPLINENDTVTTQEIRYGDNDRLAARIATMVNADALILLSDVDGLYTESPQKNPHAKHLDVIEEITPEIENMASGAASLYSRGGMATKVAAAKMATSGGIDMMIASGLVQHPLAKLGSEQKYTLFKSTVDHATARKSWLASHMDERGEIIIDAGASQALLTGSSLLAAGITHVEGEFERGDVVVIVNQEGMALAKGIVAYDYEDAQKIAGHRSEEFQDILGYPPRGAFIHRDDLVLLVASGATE